MKQLTQKQAAIKHAVNNSKHTLKKIAAYSGYSDSSIGAWMRGRFEPSDNAFEAVSQAITELEPMETQGQIKWKPRLAELKDYREQGLTVQAIAEKFGTEPGSVSYAIHKFLRAA